MYLPDHIGTGDIEHVIVASELVDVVYEAFTTEVALGEMITLYHRSHGAVEHQYALFYCLYNR